MLAQTHMEHTESWPQWREGVWQRPEGARGQIRAGGGTGGCVDGKGGKKGGSAIRTAAIARCTRSASARLHSGARAKDNNALIYGSSAPVQVCYPEL